MEFPPPPELPEKKGSERRTRGRLSQEELTCDLGTVLDLSGGGMRILTRRAFHKGDQTAVVLLSPTSSIQISARIAWIKKAGFFKSEVGLQFTDLNPALTRSLTQICTDHRMRRVVGETA